VAVFPNEKDIPNVRILGLQVTSLDTIKSDWEITPKDFPKQGSHQNQIFHL
jgi:hypothetical protein